MRIYRETQEELTSELSDFKEKYREVVDLLHDTQNELKAAKKRSYPGMGEHKVSGMFETKTSTTSHEAKKIKGELLNLKNSLKIFFAVELCLLLSFSAVWMPSPMSSLEQSRGFTRDCQLGHDIIDTLFESH